MGPQSRSPLCLRCGKPALRRLVVLPPKWQGSQSMAGHTNFILNRIDPMSLGDYSRTLLLSILRRAQVLAETHQRVPKVYFPRDGITSNVVQLANGGAVETAMI